MFVPQHAVIISFADRMYKVAALDESDPQAVVVYPTATGADPTPTKFPILAYAHGAAGGGWCE